MVTSRRSPSSTGDGLLALLVASLTARRLDPICRLRALRGVEDGNAICRTRHDRSMLDLTRWNLEDDSLVGLVEGPRKDGTERMNARTIPATGFGPGRRTIPPSATPIR